MGRVHGVSGEVCWDVPKGGGEGSCGKRYGGVGGGKESCLGRVEVWGKVWESVCGEWGKCLCMWRKVINLGISCSSICFATFT